jgi:hypothetical protein
MQCPWEGWAPASVRFCEQELCAWVTQPANTYSNIFFLVAGFFIVRHFPKHWMMWILGFSSGALAVASGLFHASSTFFFEVFDMLGMYCIAAIMIVGNLRRLGFFAKKESAVFAYCIYVGLILSALVVNILLPSSGIALFATYMWLALTLELEIHVRTDYYNYRFLAAAVMCFGVSFAFWLADIQGWWCNPDRHWINGHAIWHFLNAFTIVLFAYFYARSGILEENQTYGRKA